MADSARARRLAKRIAQIVASGLEHEVKDPRLAMVTITDARITADLRDATVYYTVFGDDTDESATAAALHSATGVLRSRVGQQTGVRFTPTLTFVADSVPGNARRLDEVLAQAKEADAEVARLASTASPAGEVDPYRRSDEGEEDTEAAAATGEEREPGRREA
ncbi:30S ribosome-binding factor RbfA [Actinopolyspora erythraea]|uniref:Ribosome-binding factor A n=1 Tax=Actinopolyspora erythraea TaxID=414996 RepID=A0A099D780_9ACTN|nr:30S ribosome-binding factor RbfA [Actinopolyspora erythraea]ASU78190.1 30S ribosome-binding factor RbfA [Actinopolyspora erythraea]KGI81869.1 ribosome-binding factor A [Actinopolyspora erythraea]